MTDARAFLYCSGRGKEVNVFCKCFSAVVSGINGRLVTVEVDIRNGLPCFQMVGGIAGEVKEAKERVKIALENSGFILPPKHITVNMTPAEIKKEGTLFDLPVAAALLAAFGYIPDRNTDKYLIVGELSLDGKVKKIGSLLPLIFVAKEYGLGIICPKENYDETGWSDGVPICGVSDVEELADVLSENDPYSKFSPITDYNPICNDESEIDPFHGIFGNFKAKRALVIAAAGGHGVFMTGNAENEKRKLAEAFTKLLPDLTHNEMIQILKLDSVLGERPNFKVIRRCVCLNTAETVEPQKLCMAHKGVLFVENANSSKNSNVALIKDCNEKNLLKLGSYDEDKCFPCDFDLVVSGRLCACGVYPDKEKCTCTLKQIKKHTSEIDTFYKNATDLLVNVYEPVFSTFLNSGSNVNKNRKMIFNARKRQYIRFTDMNRLNADMTDSETERICALSEDCRIFLTKLLPPDFFISDYFKLLRVGRTIADVEDSDMILSEHLEEAFDFIGGDRIE